MINCLNCSLIYCGKYLNDNQIGTKVCWHSAFELKMPITYSSNRWAGNKEGSSIGSLSRIRKPIDYLKKSLANWSINTQRVRHLQNNKQQVDA